MRFIAVVLISAFVSLHALALEVSTGFLIGPRHDPRAFYFREQPGGVWQKSYAGRGFRRQAQGRLVGVTIGSSFASTESLARQGLFFARVKLQSSQFNAFEPDGSLRPDTKSKLKALLSDAAERGVAVELVLFDASQDENFVSPECFDRAVSLVTDWLIDNDLRHVFINPGGDWTAPGWDFDHHVPQHLPHFAQLIRDRFQARRTDYALPIAMHAGVKLAANSPVVQEADILVAEGEGMDIDPRTIERPILVLAPSAAACASAFERFSGCLLDSVQSNDLLDSLSPIVKAP